MRAKISDMLGTDDPNITWDCFGANFSSVEDIVLYLAQCWAYDPFKLGQEDQYVLVDDQKGRSQLYRVEGESRDITPI